VRGILLANLALAAAFLVPAVRNWGLRVRLSSWNLAGMMLMLCYIGAAIYAHNLALARVDNFSSALHLEVQARGALPFPPSLWHWDGLVLTPRGVYELRMNLAGEPSEVQAAASNRDDASSLTYRFYPD